MSASAWAGLSIEHIGVPCFRFRGIPAKALQAKQGRMASSLEIRRTAAFDEYSSKAAIPLPASSRHVGFAPIVLKNSGGLPPGATFASVEPRH
jgi:hypothetical protein